MRQEPIYVVNNSEAIKNRVINNFNTSSDYCIFVHPTYSIDNTGLIMTGITINDSLVNIIEKNTVDINFNFYFDESLNESTTFNYEVYKYNPILTSFNSNPLIINQNINESSLIGSTGYTINMKINKLQPDGEYLIKTKFNHLSCGYILSKLGVINTTSDYNSNLLYGNYNPDYDAYFILMTNPDKPILTINTSVQTESGALITEQTIIMDNQQTVVIEGSYVGKPIVTLNGLTLSEIEDFTINNNVITFNGLLVNDDLINVIYSVSQIGNGINNETIDVGSIISGVTNGEGLNKIYYNTDTNKFEGFINNTITNFNGVIITLNGATLMNGVDYYQSTSNPKKIIFNGLLVNNDFINIFYIGFSSFNGNIVNPNFSLYWELNNIINNENGEFIVYLSEDISFSTLINEIIVPYESYVSNFATTLLLPGQFGDNYYIKVVNRKKYLTIANELLIIENESSILPITLTSNSNNSY